MKKKTYKLLYTKDKTITPLLEIKELFMQYALFRVSYCLGQERWSTSNIMQLFWGGRIYDVKPFAFLIYLYKMSLHIIATYVYVLVRQEILPQKKLHTHNIHLVQVRIM